MSYKNYYRYRKMMANGGPTDPPVIPKATANYADSSAVAKSALSTSGFYSKHPNYKLSYELPIKNGRVPDNIEEFLQGDDIRGNVEDGQHWLDALDQEYYNLMARTNAPEDQWPKIFGHSSSYGTRLHPEKEMHLYRQNLDANKFKQRELTTGRLNLGAPMVLYDRRITPQSLKGYQGYGVDDFAEVPYYDPLAVTPWQDLTPEEQVERRNKYGDTGTPYDPAIPKPFIEKIPGRPASSLEREVKRDELTQEMKDAGFTGYSAREVLKPGSDAAKSWEAFKNATKGHNNFKISTTFASSNAEHKEGYNNWLKKENLNKSKDSYSDYLNTKGWFLENKDGSLYTSERQKEINKNYKPINKKYNQVTNEDDDYIYYTPIGKPLGNGFESYIKEYGADPNYFHIPTGNFRVSKAIVDSFKKPKKPKYPKSAPEGYSLVKGWTGGDGVSYGDYYTYTAGAKDLDKYPDIPAGLPKKQYGGPIGSISTETLPLIDKVTKNLAKSEENKQFLISMANSPLFGERYKRMSGNPDLTDKEIESYRQDIINNLNTARPIHQRSEVLKQKGASGYYRPRTKEAVIALNPKDSTQEFLKKKEEQYNKWFPKQSHSMNLSYGYDFNPSIDLHERSHSSTIGDLDLRKKDEPIARFAKGEDAHIGNYAEGTFLETPYQKLFPTLNTKQEKYLTEPTEQKARKDALAKYAQERGIYDPVNETFNETHYEKLMDDYYRVGGKKDRETVENIFNKDPYIYHQLDDTLKNYNKENVINMFNDFVQNENQEQELPMAAYGGPIETPWFMPDVYANGGTVDGDPPLTWKNNKDYIQGIGDWGIASDVPITNRQSDDIKRKLRTGKYGYDPSTGTLNILNENDWGTISAEDAPYVNQAIAHANRTPEEQQAFEKAKQENEYKKFKSGKQRVKIDQFTEGFKGKKVGDVAHLTDDEYNNYLNQWDKNSYDQISKGMLWNAPGMVATAGLLPNVGVLPGVIPGVAAGTNEFYQGNPGKGALYTGLSLLPGIPPAYQGIKKGVSTTTTPLGKNLIATDFPTNRFARKHLTSSKSEPLLKLITQRHPDITNVVRNKDGFSIMRQNPTDKSYYFNAYMTNPRDAGKAFKHFEKKLPPGALVKSPSTSTLSDDSFGFILNRTKNKNYTPEITGESVYLNPYAGKSMGEVSGIKSSGNVTKIDGNSVMTFSNKKDALKHAKGINAKIDKANFNTKKVSAEVVPVPGSVNEYAIKVPNIGIRNTPKPTPKGVPAVNTKVPPKGDEPYLGSTQSNLTKEESILNSFSKVKKPTTKYDPAGNIVRESKIPQPVPKKLPWKKWNPETVKDEAIMAELKELERTVDMPDFNTLEGSYKKLSETPLISKFAAEKGISENEVAQMQYLMSKTKAYKKFSEDGLHKTYHGSRDGGLENLDINKNIKHVYNKGLYQTDEYNQALGAAGPFRDGSKVYHLAQQKQDVLDLTNKIVNGKKLKNYEIDQIVKDFKGKSIQWREDGTNANTWTKSSDKARPKNLLGNKGTFDININDINQALLPIMGAGALGAGLPEKAYGGSPMMAHGGTPQYEAEGGEVIQGKNPQVYNGGNLKQISEDSFKIEGNSHENGGVAMSGGDYVYSDRIALDNNILSQLDL